MDSPPAVVLHFIHIKNSCLLWNFKCVHYFLVLPVSLILIAFLRSSQPNGLAQFTLLSDIMLLYCNYFGLMNSFISFQRYWLGNIYLTAFYITPMLPPSFHDILFESIGIFFFPSWKLKLWNFIRNSYSLKTDVKFMTKMWGSTNR